ncbi:MAG: hypothetical protein GOP50_03310 [Candidatus Heimdallarchaeota archaeon]|nr:hypothetical protein [Candidatus Heimdallarchaeota archaeon]
MLKKTSIMLILIATSLVINQNSVKGEIEPELVPISLQFVHAARYDLGEQVAVEFNDTLMPDNAVYGPDDVVWFSFTYDVAEFRFDTQQSEDWSQANYWYFAEEDEYGVYNETRFQGILNVYLDGTDFGLSNIHTFADTINTTQDLWHEYLAPGWHILTVFAAEYVSDPARTSMYWQTAKDEKWFYVSLDTEILPPAREISEETLTVKANPLASDEWDPNFDWEFLNIWPRARSTVGTPLSQEITEAGQGVQVQADFNVTTGSLMLNGTNSSGSQQAVFYDPAHMGDGTIFWWINDGPVTDDLEATFELHRGPNFIYFAAIGFRVYYSLWYEELLTPRADIDSNVFSVTESIPTETAPFGFESFVLALGIFATISIFVKKRRE